MATSYTTTDRNDRTDIPRDDHLPSVRSRINWGPVLAGSVVALALYFALTMLGAAIGMTLLTQTNNDQVSNTSLNVAGAIWAVLSTAICLFAGGWVASQMAIGETPREGVVTGIVVWGTVMGMIMLLMSVGMSGGLAEMANTATGRGYARGDVGDRLARQVGVPKDRVDAAKDSGRNSDDNNASADDSRQAAANRTTAAAWWALAATVISMAAAIGGSIVGCGSGRLSLATDPRVDHTMSPPVARV